MLLSQMMESGIQERAFCLKLIFLLRPPALSLSVLVLEQPLTRAGLPAQDSYLGICCVTQTVPVERCTLCLTSLGLDFSRECVAGARLRKS